MNGSSPNFVSQGLQAFLYRLSPNGQPEGSRSFPDSVDRSVLRFQRDETVKQWFNRCVDDLAKGDINLCQVEANLAAFASVSWKQTDELVFVTISILKTDRDLTDYYDLTESHLHSEEWKSCNRPQYMRLDLDYNTLGPIGTHPFPHVHYSPDGPPRGFLETNGSRNVVVDFMDFVHRQFFPRAWLNWARGVWQTRNRGLLRPEEDPFETIVRAYAENQIGILPDLQEHIDEVAKVLNAEKRDMYRLRVNTDHQRLMAFPNM